MRGCKCIFPFFSLVGIGTVSVHKARKLQLANISRPLFPFNPYHATLRLPLLLRYFLTGTKRKKFLENSLEGSREFLENYFYISTLCTAQQDGKRERESKRKTERYRVENLKIRIEHRPHTVHRKTLSHT